MDRMIRIIKISSLSGAGENDFHPAQTRTGVFLEVPLRVSAPRRFDSGETAAGRKGSRSC